MANPWDNDPIIEQPIKASPTANGAMPWESDPIVADEMPVTELPAVNALPPDPTDGMSGGDRFLAGLGKSFVDTFEGGRQAVVDLVSGPARGAFDSANEARVARGMAPLAASDIPVVGAVFDYQDQLRQQAGDRRQTDQALLNTGAGLAGNVAGTVGQLLTPGIAARGTSAAAAFLPTTIRGNALQGAALAASQPVAAEGERGVNALIGLAGGAAGGAVGRAAGAGANALGRLSRPGLSAADRGAADILLREAADPMNLQRAQPSAVPGVQRTLAEESLDPGIARVERNVRSTSNQFDAIDRSNNAARVAAIETFAQDEPALAAARAARSQQTEALRDQAMQDTGVDVAAVRTALQDQLEKTATRPSVQSALLDVQRSLDEAGDDVFSLYGTRKYIGDLLSGKAGSDKSYAQAATRELMQLKNVLDEKLADASPSFDQYLTKYRDLSVPINRMEVGQALTSRTSGGAVLDPVTGAQVLTPAQFSKASRSLDDVAAKATGFKKARADQILRPADIAIIKAVQDDLERQAFRATAGSGGNSQTFERLALQDRITAGAGREIIGAIPGGRYVAGLMDALDKSKNDQLKERLAYLVANPDEARRVINALPPAGRTIVQNAIEQLSGVSGRSAQPALTD